MVSASDIPATDDDFPTGDCSMHPFALLIAFTARLLSILTGGAEAGEAAERRRMTDPLICEPHVWEKVAAWLGWIPMRARRAPVYARRVPPDSPRHPESWSRSGS
jgi:hypothetical protein